MKPTMVCDMFHIELNKDLQKIVSHLYHIPSSGSALIHVFWPGRDSWAISP